MERNFTRDQLVYVIRFDMFGKVLDRITSDDPKHPVFYTVKLNNGSQCSSVPRDLVPAADEQEVGQHPQRGQSVPQGAAFASYPARASKPMKHASEALSFCNYLDQK